MGIYRFLLAISVLVTHSEPIMGVVLLNGDYAVTSFFVVSGFLIARILEEKYKYDLPSFYMNRALRIYPAYWVVLICSVFLMMIWPTGSHNPWANVRGDDLITIFMSGFVNLSLVFSNLVNFVDIAREGGLVFPNFLHEEIPSYGGHNAIFVPQSWTLWIELQFYLLIPFVLRKGLGAVILAILFSYSVDYILYLIADYYRFRINIEYLFSHNIRYFAFGVLSYLIFYRSFIFRRIDTGVSKCVSLILMLYLVFMDIDNAKAMGDAYFLLVAVTLPFLFSFDLHACNFSYFFRMLGQLSYPIYLTHFVLAKIFMQYLEPSEARIFFIILVSCLSAILLLLFEEKFVKNLKRK